MVALSPPEHRSAPALGDPPDDLTDLPRALVSAGQRWFREHGDRSDAPDRGCWWHSSWTDRRTRAGGRFDLPEPEGTCYLADEEGAAARERVGRILAARAPIPPSMYEGRTITEVYLPEPPGPVADLCDPDAALLGVTAEIHTLPNYFRTVAWAIKALAGGFGGLRYLPRFTPGGAHALALFGPQHSHPARGIVTTRPLAEVLDGLGIRRTAALPTAAVTTAVAVDDSIKPEDAEPED